MGGALLPGEPVVVHQVNSEPADLSIDSSGQEYLVAWSEGMRQCAILCPPAVLDVRAARLRTDATRFDADPLHLDQGHRSNTAVAWDGSSYVVVWSGFAGALATRISREGAGSGEPVLIDSASMVSLERYGSRVVLVTGHGTWHAAVFDRSTALEDIGAIPRTLLAGGGFQRFATLAVAGRGDVLSIAYNRIDDSAGGVPRMFLRRFDDTTTTRRRAIAH
jgi:hypothetical protein